ncbi:hypothetical protein [Roseivirga misakiensis]|uniref:ABC transporter permease n=1 Tax=Roseivirga misakiensis TaxID=1563681 RepID=A0A1E5T2V9_9BACT|nr:hypothetical protein [Roseivirga misakiensis]OEK05715.1 hypothetical protein BFP71_06220 [Roseivirga misakiensis]
MKVIYKVLIRTLVKEFYKENTGFLLLTIGLGFGFLKTPEHIAIASALAFNPVYYLVVLGLWLFYTFKAYQFCQNAKLKTENWILTEIILVSPFKRKLISFYLQCLILAPILGYSTFLTMQAAHLGQFSSAIFVGLGNLSLLLISGIVLDKTLAKPTDFSRSITSNTWTRFLPKSYSFYFIHHLLHRHGFPLLLTKIFAIGLIFGATAIFNVEGVDLRYLSLGILLTSAFNANLTLKHKQFDVNNLKLFRNLPVSNLSIFSKDYFSYLIIALPEILVLLGNNVATVPLLHLVKLSLLLPSLLLLHKGVSMIYGKDMEQFMRYVFFLTAILFFVILGYTDLLIIEIISITISAIIYLKYWHKAEVD